MFECVCGGEDCSDPYGETNGVGGEMASGVGVNGHRERKKLKLNYVKKLPFKFKRMQIQKKRSYPTLPPPPFGPIQRD